MRAEGWERDEASAYDEDDISPWFYDPIIDEKRKEFPSRIYEGRQKRTNAYFRSSLLSLSFSYSGFVAGATCVRHTSVRLYTSERAPWGSYLEERERE